MNNCSGKKDINKVGDNPDVAVPENIFKENVTNMFKDLNENVVKLTEYKCRKSID